MSNREYEDIFPDIAKEHKIMDLSIFAKILSKAGDDISKDRRVTKTGLARTLNVKRSIISNKIDTLEDFDYIEQKGRTKEGGNRIFLSIEDEKSEWDWNKQQEQIKKHEELLVERIKTDKRVAAMAGNKLIGKFVGLYTRKRYRKALEQYSKIVEILDLRGIKENTKYVELKSLALSTSLKFKGERAIEKIKEKKKAQGIVQEETRKGTDTKGKSASASA